jgi:hypothetical protein
MPSSISIFPSKIIYGDKFETTYIVEFTYSVGCNATNARLIVVSKPDCETAFNELEHHDIDVNDTMTTLRLSQRIYDVFIQVNGQETCRSVHGLLDMTNLPGQPTRTWLRNYSNSIVLTTNVSNCTYDNPTFIIDIFNATSYGNGCVEKIELTPSDNELTVNEDGYYILNIDGLNPETTYLIVYHIEADVVQNCVTVKHIGKESDSISETTLAVSAAVSDLTIKYSPVGSYPTDQSDFGSPEGFQLDWNSGTNPVSDEGESNIYYKIERQNVDQNTWVTLTDENNRLQDVGDNTYTDTNNLIVGHVYKYHIYPGLMTNGAIVWIENYESKRAPYYTTPDSLTLSVNGSGCGEVKYVKSMNESVEVQWNSNVNLNGYTLTVTNNNSIKIVDQYEAELLVENTGSYTFEELEYGREYTKTVSYQVDIDDAKDLVLPESPYNVPSSTIRFIPYTTPATPDGLNVELDNEFTACDYNATATVTWNSVSSGGIQSDVRYHVSVKEKGNSILEEDIVTNLVKVFTLESGKEYTFSVYARQYDEECDISEESEPVTLDVKIKSLSEQVENLNVSYKYRNPINIDELSDYDEVAPYNTVTNYSEQNKLIISAGFPLCQSWDIPSEYYMSITNVVSDVLVGRDGDTSSTPNSIFNSNGLEYALDPEELQDNTTYTLTVTPQIENRSNQLGVSSSVTFGYFVIPQVTSVSAEVNTNKSITISWLPNLTSTNGVYYDIYVKKGAHNKVFYIRVADQNSYTIYANDENYNYISLDVNTEYTFYVRAWKAESNTAYLSEPVASEPITYWEPPTLDEFTLPYYNDKTTRDNDQSQVSASLDISPNVPVLSNNGVLTVNYQLQYKKATTRVNENTIIYNNTAESDEWVDFGDSTTTPRITYSSIELTNVGYYNFRLAIVSYEDRNKSSDNLVTLNPPVYSNESDLFFNSDPLLTTIVNDFILGKLRVTATVYNNWSIVSSGISVFIPSNSDEYPATSNTLQLYERENMPVTRSAKLSELLSNSVTENIQFNYPDFMDPRYSDIQKNFVVLANSVGLSHMNQ